jgi:hypothetical protein
MVQGTEELMKLFSGNKELGDRTNCSAGNKELGE